MWPVFHTRQFESSPSTQTSTKCSSSNVRMRLVSSETESTRRDSGVAGTGAIGAGAAGSGSGPGSSNGRSKSESIQQGTSGTPVPLYAIQYYARTVGGVTVNPVATDTVYRTRLSALYNIFGIAGASYGEPRIFGAQLRYRFGP